MIGQGPARQGLFLGEGPADAPFADLVQRLFLRAGVDVRLTSPDLSLLRDDRTRTSSQKLSAALQLLEDPPEVVVMHRDADTAGAGARREELRAAAVASDLQCPLLPLVPVRTAEAWLLLDEAAIRRVAGRPDGRARLDLPPATRAERVVDPKETLRQALLTAAEVRGRRHKEAVRRFPAHRRQLLERLDVDGPVASTASFSALCASVAEVASELSRPHP